MKLLKQHFLSSWSLLAEVEGLSKDSSDPNVKEIAKTSFNGYEFPVQSLVQYPNGTILSRLNANKLFDVSGETSATSALFDDPINTNYYNFLKEGLKKANRD